MKILIFLKKHKLTLAGVFAGALAGFLYYYFVGCSNGTCAISSKPLNSSLYGAVMGALLFNLFEKKPKKEKREDREK